MRIFYTLLLTMLVPFMVARLLWRSLRQRGYRENVGERFGRYDLPPTKNCIWIHAVSVGETRAAAPLIRELAILYPTRPILLTCMTPTGRATANELFGDSVISVYLPYDFVALHRRLMRHFQPAVLLIMETEIWPNLLYACQKNSVPALLVNARLSEKSTRGYARIAAVRALTKQSLQLFNVVAAQSPADAERFRALGADNIVVSGNIKFDLTLAPEMIKLGQAWRAARGAGLVLVCASTREGEEALLLAAYAQVFSPPERRDTLLVIVPRHPQRFDRVADEIERAGFRLSRRSLSMQDSSEVLLGDSMGEMAAYFSFADIVIIGGSFLPLGGQNLIEACAAGRPVIMGPSAYNFAEAAKFAEDSGAALRVADASEAMRAAHRLLGDGARRARMSAAGQKLVEANRGATQKTLALVAPILGAD
jgi:3-deoxy-D-manno-octulosonic-acid transferase